MHVFACALGVAAGDRWDRVAAAGLAAKIVPIRAEAHAPPFAESLLDAIVSLDA